jgi:hypothetical protein
MPNPRGSWTLHKAIKDRWFARNLDGVFREAWPEQYRNPARSAFHTLNETEARAGNHPTPYCVYEVEEGYTVAQMSGGAQTLAQKLADPTGSYAEETTERRLEEVPVTFKVYGIDKSQAVQYAKLVAAAFDKALLSLEDDEHNETLKGADFGTREGDSRYFWTLIYRFRIDCAYAAEHS